MTTREGNGINKLIWKLFGAACAVIVILVGAVSFLFNEKIDRNHLELKEDIARIEMLLTGTTKENTAQSNDIVENRTKINGHIERHPQ